MGSAVKESLIPLFIPKDLARQ